MSGLMEASTITYSASSASDSLLEAGKDFVIKLLVDEDGRTTLRRIRLFRIFDQASGKISYERLVRLVSSKVRYHQDVRLSYLDIDEDCIVVDSTDELVDAIEQFAEQRVLRLFVGDVTPSMRQEYLAIGAGCPTSGGGGKKFFPNGYPSPEMEQIIERQIEQVLEKRFRALVEQRRREQEGENISQQQQQQPPPLHLHQNRSLSPSPHHHPPPLSPAHPHQQTQQPPRSASPSMHIREEQYRYQQQIQQQRRHSFGGSQGWGDSPRATSPNVGNFPTTPGGTVMSPNDMIGDEDYLPNESKPPHYSIRLPWERSGPGPGPFPPTSRPPHPTGKTGNRYMEEQDRDRAQIVDLSRLSRKPQSPSPVAGVRTKRIHIGRDPSPTMGNSIHRSHNNEMAEEDDYNDGYDEMRDDDMEGNDDYEFQENDNQQNDSQYWDNNTVDSDAELSLLLSDTDFRDLGKPDDVTTQRGGSSIMSSSQMSEERQDENVHKNARSPPPQTISKEPPADNTKQPELSNSMNSSAQTPTASNTKQQPARTKSNSSSNSNHNKFNSIPRSTPPTAKKNKLLGLLYSGA